MLLFYTALTKYIVIINNDIIINIANPKTINK